MGAATSSNISEAIATVTNDIQNNTDEDSSQINKCKLDVELKNCNITRGLDVKDSCVVNGQSKQIITSINENNLNNDISQKLLQQAQSTVGSMGIGYASASNTSTALSNASTAISNSIATISKQNSDVDVVVKCENSEIDHIYLDISSRADFLSEQVIDSKETNVIVNNISQDITQKASATVEGLAGFLIALAILILAIGYVVFKPAGLLLNSKLFILLIVLGVITAIIVYMYIKKLPPFFNTPNSCVENSSLGCNEKCVNITKKKIKVTSPPLRYAWDVVGNGDTSLGQNPSSFTPGLLQAVISKEGGWNESTFNSFKNTVMSEYEFPVNPLVKNDDDIYITNKHEWMDHDKVECYDARFLLCRYLKIPLNVYQNLDEECFINGKLIPKEEFKTKCIKYTPETPAINCYDRITGPGVLEGLFGFCNTNSYKISSNVKKYWYVSIVLLIIISFIILFVNKKNKPASLKS